MRSQPMSIHTVIQDVGGRLMFVVSLGGIVWTLVILQKTPATNNTRGSERLSGQDRAPRNTNE